MTTRPQQVTHYADGTPSEVRDMTDEEIAQLPEAVPYDLASEPPA
jgi:hypothetical protein